MADEIPPLINEPHVQLMPSAIIRLCEDSNAAFSAMWKWYHETSDWQMRKRDAVREKQIMRIRRRLLNSVQDLLAKRLKKNEERLAAATKEWEAQRFNFLPKSLRRFSDQYGVMSESRLAEPYKRISEKIEECDARLIKAVWLKWWKTRASPFDANFFNEEVKEEQASSTNKAELMFDYKYDQIMNKHKYYNKNHLAALNAVESLLNDLPGSEFKTLVVCASAFPNNMLLISAVTVAKMKTLEERWKQIVTAHPRVKFPCIHFGSSHDS